MATDTVYATAGADGMVRSKHMAYTNARQGAALAATDATLGSLGQWYTTDGGVYKHLCTLGYLSFDTSGVTGTVDTLTLGLLRSAAASTWSDQPFTLNARVVDYGASLTTDDWISGAVLSGYTLAGTCPSDDFPVSPGGYMSIVCSGYHGEIVGDAYQFVLSSDKHEAGEALVAGAGAKAGYVTLVGTSGAGTTSDPKLVIVSGDNPSDCIITSPAFGSYDGIIDLTATATDPNGGNITYAWEYSLDGGDNWTACANSPSAATASGSPGTITFDTSVASVGAEIELRVRAYNGALYSFNMSSIAIARGSQSGALIYRTAGTDVMAYPVSGLSISRPVCAASACKFAVDNFDAAEAGITDDDEIIIHVPYYQLGAVGSYSWRGFVREKRVGDIMEVTCADIAYRFPGLLVTRMDLIGEQTVGTIVKAIVENPTGSDATGIIATCAEVDDPANPGSYLAIASFNSEGQTRTLLDWLNELADWTGCQWYVYHDGSVWQFKWFDPSANAPWAVACKDNIDFLAESTSQARVINSPVVVKDRQQYINRVWYWYDLRTTATGSTAADTAYSEATTPWSVLNGGATIATDNTNKTSGSYSVKFTDASYASNDKWCFMLTLDAADYDWTAAAKQYFKFDFRWSCDQDVYLIQPAGIILVSGATAPTSYADLANVPRKNTEYGYLPQPLEEGNFAVVTADAVSSYLGGTQGGFDSTDVRYVVIYGFASTAAAAALTLWIDNVRWDTEGDYELPDNEPIWVLGKVETAAVTAGTEEPIEVILSTRLLDYTAAASLAQGYLDAYAKTRVGVDGLELFGVRELDLDKDITLTLSARGITATAYPITKIEYRLFDQGHVTSVSLGDPLLQWQNQMERLVRRLADVTTEVRS